MPLSKEKELTIRLELLINCIFTIKYSTVRACEGNHIVISISGNIETIRAAVDGIEDGIECRFIGKTNYFTLHSAEVGRERECKLAI